MPNDSKKPPPTSNEPSPKPSKPDIKITDKAKAETTSQGNSEIQTNNSKNPNGKPTGS